MPIPKPRRSAQPIRNLTSEQCRTAARLKRDLHQESPARLSVWYAVGQFADETLPSFLEGRGGNFAEALAKALGCSRSELYAARKFARVYTARQAKALESKLSWSRILRLIAIDNPKQRKRLETACIRGNWTVSQLDRQIRIRLGRQRSLGQGGRPSRRPLDVKDALADLDRRLGTLLSWYRKLGGSEGAAEEPTSKGRVFGEKQLPPAIRRKLKSAMESLDELRQAVHRQL